MLDATRTREWMNAEQIIGGAGSLFPRNGVLRNRGFLEIRLSVDNYRTSIIIEKKEKEKMKRITIN